MSKVFYLHDAEISTLTIDRANQVVKIAFVSEQGEASALTFQGVLAFRCVDLSMQNVVSRVVLSDNREFDKVQIKYWIKWATSFPGAELSWLSPDALDTMVERCHFGAVNLAVIEPSVGAECAIIYESVACVGPADQFTDRPTGLCKSG